MPEAQVATLQSLFPDWVDFGEPKVRRRVCTAPAQIDSSIVDRTTRLEKRNRVLAARWYYWTEVRRRRFDDVLNILADREFFLEPRTISNIIVDQQSYIDRLIMARPTMRELRDEFVGWDFTPPPQ